MITSKNYEDYSINELQKLYKNNESSIIYYENEIKSKEKFEFILIGIMFLASLLFGILGIYFIIKNQILVNILIVAFIISNIIIYSNINFEQENKERLEYFKNENEKIKLILEIKGVISKWKKLQLF